jgi:hypothetical protein
VLRLAQTGKDLTTPERDFICRDVIGYSAATPASTWNGQEDPLADSDLFFGMSTAATYKSGTRRQHR